LPTTTDDLWFDNRSTEQTVRDEIEKHALSLKRLTVLNQPFLIDGCFKGLFLPQLEELVVPSLYYFDNQSGWEFLYGMPNLKVLVADYTTAKDSMLEGLSQAPWWNKLTQLELKFADLKETTKWHELWAGKTLALKTLCLFYLDAQKTAQIFTSKLEQLQYLILGTELGSDFLHYLAKSNLPNLEDLDLSHSSLGIEETVQFIEQPRPGLPKLQRVRKRIASDQRIEYHDWNGTPVDWGYGELSDSEIEQQYLKKSGLKILPANEQLISRGATMSSPLRALERPPKT